MSIINISIPKYLRNQVDELVKQGAFSTISEAVRRGLILLISQEKLKRWDDEIYAEYEAGVLHRNPRSGVLFSRQFQKDLNLLVKKEPELKRKLWAILLKLTGQNTNSLEIKQLRLKNYSFVDFKFRHKTWRILIRKQGKDLIACRIGLTTAQFFL